MARLSLLYRGYMVYVIPQTRGLGRGFLETFIWSELQVDFAPEVLEKPDFPSFFNSLCPAVYSELAVDVFNM